MTVLAGSRVVTPTGILAPGVVELDGERIVSVGPTTGLVPDRTLVPGYVDLQVNGVDDVDVATADAAGWERLDALVAAQGTTTWLPTLVTAPLDHYPARLTGIADAAARGGERPRIAGVHLEGPFLGSRPGAHRVEHVVAPDPEWLEHLDPVVSLVTLGAEHPETGATIKALARRHVLVAIGHTGATHDATRAAVDAGARLVTHAFNAMSPLHHREPGVVGAALTDDRVAVSLIADLVHVHPAALQIAFRCKPDGRIVLVTDAVAWRAGRAGEIRLSVRHGAPQLADGTLAGSALTMDAAVANVVGAVGVALDRAVRAASSTPAALLGLADRGALVPGRLADLAALDPVSLRCTETWVGGAQVHG